MENETPTPENPQTPPPPPPSEPEATAPVEVNKDDKTMAMLSHLLGLLTGFIGPLVIWLIKKEQGGYVSDQSKEALNFQITVLLAFIIAGLSTMICIGAILLPAVWIADIVLCIMACVATNKGQPYRYPVCLRLIK